MPVYLGIDYGLRRIGIAVSDDAARHAFAVGTHREGRDGSVFAYLRDVATRYGVTAVVVGLPLTAAGDEGEIARRARSFAHRLGEQLGLPVHLYDERYTSQQAERILAGTRRPRESVDALAAELILQSYLDRRTAREDAP